MGRLSAGVSPAPGVRSPAARDVVCVSVCTVCRRPSGGRGAPCCSSVSLPCVSAHMSDRGRSHVVCRPRTWSAASGFPFFWPPPGSLVA